jgi:hypothetical protein
MCVPFVKQQSSRSQVVNIHGNSTFPEVQTGEYVLQLLVITVL